MRHLRIGAGFGRRRGGLPVRLLVAGVIAVVSLISYCSLRSENPITGQTQYVALSVDEEIALGLKAAPQMASEFGGLHPDPQLQQRVETVGTRLLSNLGREMPYEFDFHVLGDEQTINAFALPGGQVFITAGLLGRLETEGQLAGVLAHEIGHVLERHGAEHLAKERLTQGLTGATVIAMSDPENPSGPAGAAVAMAIGRLINLRYGRADELESDAWGVRLMASAGYDPRAMIRMMEILAESSGPSYQPEFFSSHPNPDNRVATIEAAIQRVFPGGVPPNLKP